MFRSFLRCTMQHITNRMWVWWSCLDCAATASVKALMGAKRYSHKARLSKLLTNSMTILLQIPLLQTPASSQPRFVSTQIRLILLYQGWLAYYWYLLYCLQSIVYQLTVIFAFLYTFAHTTNTFCMTVIISLVANVFGPYYYVSLFI